MSNRNFQYKKKLEFTSLASFGAEIHLDPDWVFFDLDKQPFSVADILARYEFWYIREKEVLHNVAKFLGLSLTSDLERKLIKVWFHQRLFFNKLRDTNTSSIEDRILKEIPPVERPLQPEDFERESASTISALLNVPKLEGIERPKDYESQMRNIKVIEDAQLRDNLYVKETESKIYVLTKIKPFVLMWLPSDLPKEPKEAKETLGSKHVVIDYMRYRSFRRKKNKYTKVHCGPHAFAAQISVGKNSCTLVSQNYLTCLYFNSEWAREEQEMVIERLLSKFGVVATTKRDIRLEFIPASSINISYFFVLLDVITSGENCEHFVTHEQESAFVTHKPSGDLETKKHSFYFDNKKFNFVRPALNVLIKTDTLSSTVEADYVSKVISGLLHEFNMNKDLIIQDYKKRVKTPSKIQETKKEKKTKQNVDVLRDIEQKIFKNTSYTQKCQKSRQPFLVNDEETLVSQINASLDDPYWQKELDLKAGEVATLEKILQKYNVQNVKDFILEFPSEQLIQQYPEVYSDIPPKLYACLPRKEKDRSHVFPGILRSTIKNSDGQDIKVPCCFKRRKDGESDTGAKKISTDYPLGVTRDLNEGRQGFIPHYLGSVLNEDYVRKGIKRPNFRSILDEVCKNDRRDLEATFSSTWKQLLEERGFFVEEETKKEIGEMVEDGEFIKKVNLISFILKKNIVLFDTINMYNSVLIVPRLHTTTIFPFKDFVGIRLNSVGGLEAIITRYSAYIHTQDSDFGQYLRFVIREFQKELVKLT